MKVIFSTNLEEKIEELRGEYELFQRQRVLQMKSAMTLINSQILQNIRKNAGLMVKTGALLNSVRWTIEELGNGALVGEIGPEGVPYARIHELGGTIVAKDKKLTIPTPENQRPDGLPRVTIQELFANQKENIFFAKNVLFLSEGRTKKVKGEKVAVGGLGSLKAMFILKDSVTIPARPYLGPAIDQTKDLIFEKFGLMIEAVWTGKQT